MAGATCLLAARRSPPPMIYTLRDRRRRYSRALQRPSQFERRLRVEGRPLSGVVRLPGPRRDARVVEESRCAAALVVDNRTGRVDRSGVSPEPARATTAAPGTRSARGAGCVGVTAGRE